jgi:hypothetical protein
MNAQFTLRRKYFRIAVTCLPLFVGMLVWSVIGMYTDAPPDRRLAAILAMIGGWGFFILLTVYVLMAYRKEATILGKDAVQFIGVFTDRTIRLADVKRARWYCYGKPWRLKIVTERCKRTIWFDNFYPDQTAEIVRYFRDRLDASVQGGWQESSVVWTRGRTRAELWSESLACIRKLSVKVVVLGPILGLLTGTFLYFFALGKGVLAPAWSGSVFLDCTLYGLLTSALLLAGIWWCIWIESPEQSPRSDRT